MPQNFLFLIFFPPLECSKDFSIISLQIYELCSGKRGHSASRSSTPSKPMSKYRSVNSMLSNNRLNRDVEWSFGERFNPLPHMLILGSSNSAAYEDMMSKILTNGDTIF